MIDSQEIKKMDLAAINEELKNATHQLAVIKNQIISKSSDKIDQQRKLKKYIARLETQKTALSKQ